MLSQCAVEEATELKLGMLGLTTYAETISVYGTEKVFIDGDDTPYSKTFLAAAYASRGMKMRCTSGSGSEALMGHAEKKSMLYLEARCLLMIKGGGVQGTQNGSISCIGLVGAVPSGIREVLAENLLAAMLGLEVASGNDQSFSHSDIRRTARMLMQMLPGTDFIFSGYSSVPNYDNMFAGSNFDAEDFDDYNILQRDLKVDGGLRPVTEEAVHAVRLRAAKAMQAVFDRLGFPPVSDEEVEQNVLANGSKDVTALRDVNEDLKAAKRIQDGEIGGLDVVKALDASGFSDIAASLLEMLKQRVSGDYLHTAAILDKDFHVHSSVNNPNTYQGPAPATAWTGRNGNGSKTSRRPLTARRFSKEGEAMELNEELVALVTQKVLETLRAGEAAPAAPRTDGLSMTVRDGEEAKPGVTPDEVVIGVAPAFALSQVKTIGGCPMPTCCGS